MNQVAAKALTAILIVGTLVLSAGCVDGKNAEVAVYQPSWASADLVSRDYYPSTDELKELAKLVASEETGVAIDFISVSQPMTKYHMDSDGAIEPDSASMYFIAFSGEEAIAQVSLAKRQHPGTASTQKSAYTEDIDAINRAIQNSSPCLTLTVNVDDRMLMPVLVMLDGSYCLLEEETYDTSLQQPAVNVAQEDRSRLEEILEEKEDRIADLVDEATRMQEEGGFGRN